MPIYEYACGKCEHEFEVEQRITDDPVKTCPKCRSRKVKKLISQTSFVLKGSGWYSDLYSSAKGDKKDAGEKADAASAEKKGDAKADEKPAKKGDKQGEKADKKSGAKKGSKAAA